MFKGGLNMKDERINLIGNRTKRCLVFPVTIQNILKTEEIYQTKSGKITCIMKDGRKATKKSDIFIDDFSANMIIDLFS
jgi:hypothetical protein